MRYFYAFLLLALGLGRAAHAQQPFLKYGVTVKVATLSNGRFQEFFTNDSLRRIGSVVYDTRLHRVAYLLPPDSLIGHAKAEITSRWMSPDPLAEKFMYESPYVFVSNNPVNKFDPDGRSGIAAIDRQHHTITVSSNMTFYGGGANAQVARSTAADVQNAWNAAGGHVKIGGVSYAVQFKITGSYNADLSEKEIKGNKSYLNNYIKVGASNEQSVSYMDKKKGVDGSNTGSYLTKNIAKDGSTTEAHEMGHGYGEVKGTADGHPADLDIRGEGQPGIMYPRGALVDPQYQYDPSAPAGGPGGTINPETRKVLQADIDRLNLGGLQYNSNNRANVGGLTNTAH